MGRRATALLVWAGAVALVAVLAVATHTDDKKVATKAASAASSTTVVGATTAPDTPAASETPTTAGDGAQPTSGDAGSDDGGVIAADTSPTTLAEAAKRVMPDPGTYKETVTGTASLNGQPQQVPPDGGFTIEQVSASDQRQTGGSFDLTVRWTPDSASLVSMKIAQANKEFTPSAPVLYTPFPGVAGQSWQWTVTSTDGKTTIDQTSTVTGDDVVNVGGQDLPVFVVHTVIKLSGDLAGTVELTSWVSDEHRLPLKQHVVTDATYCSTQCGAVPAGFRLQSDTTSQLVSLTPT